MLGNVAGNGNITKGAVADRYMNNIAQNEYANLPASEAKNKAIEKVNQGIGDV